MTLKAPNLDSRTFDDLVREARDRIPRYTPEWTNFNDSDPGMTLVKLHAWMTETILWELNRVPELNYIKFLDLVGITPRPARPARTRLKATLDKLDKPVAGQNTLEIPIPLGARVAVDDPALERELVFETDASARALNAGIGVVLVPSGDLSPSRKMVTRYEDGLTWLHNFDPFGPGMAVGSVLYIGLVLRPAGKTEFSEDRMPSGPLSLYADTVEVFDEGPGADAAVIEGPVATRCAAPGDAATAAARLVWQAFTGDAGQTDLFAADGDDTGWTDLAVSTDETLGLTRSGALALELPAGLTPLAPTDLDPDFWESFGADKPPQDQDELIAALQTGPAELLAGLADHWEAMGVDDPDDLAAFAACGESVSETIAKIEARTDPPDPADRQPPLDPSVLGLGDWVKISADYAQDLPQVEDRYRRLYWIRARVVSAYGPDDPVPQALKGLHLNTLRATQAVTRLGEALGRSNGRPGQVVTLAKTPVLIDPDTLVPDLDLTVDGESWERVADFYRSGPGSAHYLLDPARGTVTFGDGRRGRIPVAGAQISAARYRFGGGAIGNVPAGTVTKIKGRIQSVKSITNIREASGGSDAEALDEVLLRAPSTLRSRDRAVSAEDFSELAMETPGVPLHSATALARTAAVRQPDGRYLLGEKDGAVTLIVLPDNSQDTPQPSDAQVRAICAYLEPRRLITTELYVIGPTYAKLTRFEARVTVSDGHDLSAVTQALYTAIFDFLHPVRGGKAGTGWPFGEDIYYCDLYDVMLGVAGVRRVTGLSVDTEAGTGDPLGDMAAIPTGMLPALSRDVIRLVVSYG
ncbi:putative baseplate assembly protein [Meridianimarinicoccus sp. RP-17]|uniref:putative baseplate assembly protein n=1 Tax=Meridianimarinicoccus zhengii TaxID=2056810 RepID=UPI000DAD29F6|nr:putative baseplate assembly protein [Phycocomes zhengii]